MSLKKLRKNQRIKANSDIALKGGIVLFLDTQEQYDKLAPLIGLEVGDFIVDGDYVAYIDSQGVPTVHPERELAEDEDMILDAVKHIGVATDFDKWYKKFK